MATHAFIKIVPDEPVKLSDLDNSEAFDLGIVRRVEACTAAIGVLDEHLQPFAGVDPVAWAQAFNHLRSCVAQLATAVGAWAVIAGD